MIILTTIHIILSIAFTSVKDNSIVYSRIIQLLILYSIILLYKNFFFLTLKENIYLFNATIKCDIYSYIFIIFILLLSFFILLLTSFYPIVINTNKNNNKSLKYLILDKIGGHYKITEYSLILLFIISGALSLTLNNDLITFFLSIELQSYGLYLLSTIFKDSESSTKAGLTYFLLGGLSSCIILLALSFLYINSGNTSLENLYIIYDLTNVYNESNVLQTFYQIQHNDISFNLLKNSWPIYYYSTNYYIDITLIILSIGLLFKISGAPFHFWSPDVYDNIPTIVTTFVAIIGKLSILIVLLYLSLFFNNNYANWINNILISSLLSLIVGTVLGLTQLRIKRLYAYSTISHIGFILLALSINSLESIQAFLFYIIQYSITNLNAFILLIGIGYYMYNFNSNIEQYNNLKDRSNSPIQLISQLKGLYTLNPFLALSKTITILSFLGIPPLLGFFGKQIVLSASLDKGFVFISLIAILTSVIGGVYYLAIIKQIYFDKIDNTDYNITNNTEITLSPLFTLTISLITNLILISIFIVDSILNTFFKNTLCISTCHCEPNLMDFYSFTYICELVL